MPTACIHHSSVNWNAAPKTSPGIQALRAGSPAVTTKNAATANGSSQNAWVDGKESASASPATRATRQRVGMGHKIAAATERPVIVAVRPREACAQARCAAHCGRARGLRGCAATASCS